MIMIGFILVFAFRLFTARPAAPENRAKTVVLTLIVVSGVIASLLEPNVLVGSFQYAAIWWAAAGILVGVYARERGCREWSVPFPWGVKDPRDRDAQLRPLSKAAPP